MKLAGFVFATIALALASVASAEEPCAKHMEMNAAAVKQASPVESAEAYWKEAAARDGFHGACACPDRCVAGWMCVWMAPGSCWA